MPIPPLDALGLLRSGIFDCSLDEVQERFGKFQGSDRRPSLLVRLKELYRSMQGSGMFEYLLLDGSFVTSKPAPNDIDIIGVLKAGRDFERDLPMSEYALLSRSMLRRRFGFDVVIVERGSKLYDTYVEFFSRVRDNAEVRKGMLRIAL